MASGPNLAHSSYDRSSSVGLLGASGALPVGVPFDTSSFLHAGIGEAACMEGRLDLALDVAGILHRRAAGARALPEVWARWLEGLVAAARGDRESGLGPDHRRARGPAVHQPPDRGHPLEADLRATGRRLPRRPGQVRAGGGVARKIPRTGYRHAGSGPSSCRVMKTKSRAVAIPLLRLTVATGKGDMPCGGRGAGLHPRVTVVIDKRLRSGRSCGELSRTPVSAAPHTTMARRRRADALETCV
jgi:hypothetical protein